MNRENEQQFWRYAERILKSASRHESQVTSLHGSINASIEECTAYFGQAKEQGAESILYSVYGFLAANLNRMVESLTEQEQALVLDIAGGAPSANMRDDIALLADLVQRSYEAAQFGGLDPASKFILTVNEDGSITVSPAPEDDTNSEGEGG